MVWENTKLNQIPDRVTTWKWVASQTHKERIDANPSGDLENSLVIAKNCSGHNFFISEEI